MNQKIKQKYIGNWIWLYPVSFMIHILEEYYGGIGFYNWLAHLGMEISAIRWLAVNIFFLFIMAVAIILVKNNRNLIWILIALGIEVSLNGFGHAIGSIITKVYSPGLLSGLLIWFPLGIFTLIYSKKKTIKKIFIFGIVAGLLLRIFVISTVKMISLI